jgi:hypothetical protein
MAGILVQIQYANRAGCAVFLLHPMRFVTNLIFLQPEEDILKKKAEDLCKRLRGIVDNMDVNQFPQILWGADRTAT